MNSAHLHLLLNHLPIITPIIGIIILLLGFILQTEAIKRTALFIFILGALFTFPAFNTGEGAEEYIENIEGISEDFIKIHEEHAETFSIFSYLLGVFSSLGILASWKQKTYAKTLIFTTIGFCITTLYFARQTGTSGGEIRHNEIRSNSSLVLTKTNFKTNEKKELEENED